MALEIKGLREALTQAKTGIAAARAESAGLGEDVRKFVADVQEARKQVQQHHDDLKFELGTLGNSQSSEEKLGGDSAPKGNGAGRIVVSVENADGKTGAPTATLADGSKIPLLPVAHDAQGNVVAPSEHAVGPFAPVYDGQKRVVGYVTSNTAGKI